MLMFERARYSYDLLLLTVDIGSQFRQLTDTNSIACEFYSGRGSHAEVSRLRLLDREIPSWEIADSLSSQQIFK